MCDGDDCGHKEKAQIEAIRKILGVEVVTEETIIEKKIDTLNFANECLEHLKKIEVPDSYIQDLCNDVAEAKDDVELFEAIKLIVQGNRADVIYAFQDFATNFLSEKESEEVEG